MPRERSSLCIRIDEHMFIAEVESAEELSNVSAWSMTRRAPQASALESVSLTHSVKSSKRFPESSGQEIVYSGFSFASDMASVVVSARSNLYPIMDASTYS